MTKITLKIVLALAVTALMANPVMASEQDDVMKVVRQWVDSLNKGDIKTAIAACAQKTSIVDEFPPYARAFARSGPLSWKSITRKWGSLMDSLRSGKPSVST